MKRRLSLSLALTLTVATVALPKGVMAADTPASLQVASVKSQAGADIQKGKLDSTIALEADSAGALPRPVFQGRPSGR